MPKNNKTTKETKMGRPKPVTTKAGVSRNGKRRYCNGGKLK